MAAEKLPPGKLIKRIWARLLRSTVTRTSDGVDTLRYLSLTASKYARKPSRLASCAAGRTYRRSDAIRIRYSMSGSNTPVWGTAAKVRAMTTFSPRSVAARKSEYVVKVGGADIDIRENRIYGIGIVVVCHTSLLPSLLPRARGRSRDHRSFRRQVPGQQDAGDGAIGRQHLALDIETDQGRRIGPEERDLIERCPVEMQ